MILNRQKRVRIRVLPLEKFVQQVRRELRLNRRELSVCFVTDAEIARLNQAYRGKKEPTDVLSFPVNAEAAFRRALSRTRGHDRLEGGAALLGDIAIAPGVARRNAQRFRRTLSTELRILILHGVLHLMGYDHEADSGQMERRERRLRRRLGLE